MAAKGASVKRGFLLGKFMPPHAGHVALIDAARRLVDELTILVCSLPDDPIDGQLRFDWMKALFPDCRVSGTTGRRRKNRRKARISGRSGGRSSPRPIPSRSTMSFAGEAYGAELARQVGGLFVPLGARILRRTRRGSADYPPPPSAPIHGNIGSSSRRRCATIMR